MSIRIFSGLYPVQPGMEKAYQAERNSYNSQQIKYGGLIAIFISLVLMLRYLLSGGDSKEGFISLLYPFLLAGIVVNALIYYTFNRTFRKRLSLSSYSSFQLILITMFFFFLTGLSIIGVLLSGGLNVYLILVLFISLVIWMKSSQYCLFSILSFLLILFFMYIGAGSREQLISSVIQGFFYFTVGWFLYLSMTSLLMENFYNRVSLEEQYTQLATESITDPLTGLYNRRSLNDDLNKEWALSKRKGAPFCIMMIDIDNFHDINDIFGHTAGDQLIRDVSAILRNAVRLSDKVYRFGGEEFLIIVPETPLDVAASVSERIRKNVEKNSFKGINKTVTLSLGLAQSQEDINVDILVNRVEQKLLLAKENGRNRIEY